MTNFRHFVWVSLLFSLSLIPRIKNIQTGEYPSSIPHLQVLQVMKVWEEDGPTKHAFLPSQTWSNPNDKFITYFKRFENSEGNNYYVSYPPFAFILAWLFCQLPGFGYSVLSITILNLLLHWASAFLIFKMVVRLIPNSEKAKANWPGIAASGIFLFNPASMRLFSQVYFSESVGTALFCLCCYAFINVFQKPTSKWGLFTLFISSFLLVYTEWIGIFCTLVFALVFVVKGIRNRDYLKPFLLLIISVILGIGLFAWQLDIISNGNDFYANLEERFLARSGMREKEKSIGDTVFKDGLLEWILLNLKNTFYAVRWGFPFIILMFILFLRKRNQLQLKVSKQSIWIVSFFTIIVIINFLVFFNFSVIHSYTWTKWAVPIALCAAIVIYYLSEIPYGKVLVPTILGIWFTFDLAFYYKLSSKDEAPAYWKELTLFIREEAKPVETLYITTISEEVDPTFHLTYYTKRNLMNVNNEADAIYHAKSIGRKKYVWFNFNQMKGLKESKHYSD